LAQEPKRVVAPAGRPSEGVVRVAPREAASGPGITLLDGKTFSGTLEAITADGIRISGKKETVPAYEVQEIRLPARAPKTGPKTGQPDAGKPIDFALRPLVRFRGGEQIAARVLEVVEGDGGKLIAMIRPEGAGLPVLRVPLEYVSAFRLREAHKSDELMSKALEKPAPESDLMFIRRAGLLSVAGTLRALTKEHLIVDRGEKRSRVRRQIVQGLILAPVATRSAESDPPAILELRGVGRLPAYLVGLESSEGSRTLVVRLPGAAKDSLSRLPLAEVHRITMASDRVLFLSAAEPVAIDERPVVGKPLRYRKDKSVSGSPLSIAGRVYRRGLGVHSYCALDFNLAAQYRSFAAVIGLDDSSQGKGSVVFRVIADGKEIFKKEMSGKTRPETVSLPMEKVQVLRLVVDYGADKLDFSDHADWADARVTK
jgi:hypothetical protein